MAVIQPQQSTAPKPVPNPVAAKPKPVAPAVIAKVPVALVPKMAEDMEVGTMLRLLVLGFSKVGKSCTVISTSPGPVYVINTDQPDALAPVRRFTKDFMFNHCTSSQELSAAFETARQLVRDGKVKTVVWDTLSGFSPIVEAEAFKATLTGKGKENGMKAWPLYKKYMRGYVNRFLRLKAHAIIISHYLDINDTDFEDFDDEEETEDGKPVKPKPKPKRISRGPGIVPLVGGSLRKELGGLFQDVIFMEKELTGPGKEERFFVTGIDGVFGPGCRSVNGNRQIPADINGFIKLAREEA